MSGDVTSVAAASEELSASILEIAKQVEGSSSVTARAVAEVQTADTAVAAVVESKSAADIVLLASRKLSDQSGSLSKAVGQYLKMARGS
jgi:methyl-accepting chemotaxis protein